MPAGVVVSNGLLIKVEIDANDLEVLDGAEEVDQRSTEPVNGPRHYNIEVVPAGILEHVIMQRLSSRELLVTGPKRARSKSHRPHRVAAISDLFSAN